MQRIFIVLLLLASSSVFAQNLYISDEFKVTMRTGSSISNSIVTMLKSGEKVDVLDQDAVTQYSHVKTASGKEGYVLTRFLKKLPSHKQRLAALSQQHDQLQQRFDSLQLKHEQLLQENNQSKQAQNELEQQLNVLREQYAQLQSATKNTQIIIKKSKEQAGLIDQLRADKDVLMTENKSLKDNTAMQWFVRGAGVFLLAFLIGIIVTRIQWKKRQSWDDF